MEPMKNLCGLIPGSLHKRLTGGKSLGITNGGYLTKILTIYLDQPATAKQEQRTLAVQISDDMFQRLKPYLDAHAPLTRKTLVQSLLNQALDQWGHGEEPLQSAALRDNREGRTLAIAIPESLLHRVEQYVEAHNGVSKRVFVVGLMAQELQSWLMEQSPDEVQDQEFGPNQDEQEFGMSMTVWGEACIFIPVI